MKLNKAFKLPCILLWKPHFFNLNPFSSYSVLLISLVRSTLHSSIPFHRDFDCWGHYLFWSVNNPPKLPNHWSAIYSVATSVNVVINRYAVDNITVTCTLSFVAWIWSSKTLPSFWEGLGHWKPRDLPQKQTHNRDTSVAYSYSFPTWDLVRSPLILQGWSPLLGYSGLC